MIKVVSKFTVKEKGIQEFKGIAAELIAETRKESGCISYQLFQDVNDSKILTFIEEFKGIDSLAHHLQTPYFRSILPKLQELTTEKEESNIYSLLI
jgi:quinol monooxygenase YgiN